ncbi:hypothetical protein CCACVL1_28392 [Corchorus capsularis]|uniref:Classical arabinogalactan protein 25 n=1 Tax=Corchorus capsularis TaxID=210143 RepID=A0A1R3G6N9_COCAP|nr:hypothetical protein CCACVL1_28392 [Corchorus capsularis]
MSFFMALPLASSSSKLISSDIPTIPSSPEVSMSDPALSPYQELSPDIAPLLPSPGGVVPTTGSSMPTIPSSPSPPNPDDLMAEGPGGSAFPPFGSFPASSSSSNLAPFSVVFLACSLLQQLIVRLL